MTSNRDFRIENGRLLAYEGSDAVVHVPEGVVEIGEGAFTQTLTMAGAMGGPPPMATWDGMDNPELDRESSRYQERVGLHCLKEVYLPESVKVIGEDAFRRCANLTHVGLPDGLRVIKKGAFDMCFRLQSIEVPQGTMIERGAFYRYADKVVRVPGT